MKKQCLAVLTTSLAVTQLYSTPVTASSTNPSVMDDVVVTASRIAESKKEVSANITVITSEEIRQSSSRNVADLLAEKNIGHIQKYPGNLTSIGIRGFRTDTLGNDLQGHVLVLLDGRRAGSGNLSKFLTKNVARIEIIRGPGAVQYGSAGMGGVVNIITKQGSSNSMFLEAGAGSFGTYESSIGGEVQRNGFDFAGAYTYSTRDDYETGGGDTFNNTGVDYETGMSANLGYSLSDKQRMGIIFTRFDVSESGSPGYLSQNDLDDYTEKENYSVDLSYTGASDHDTYRWLVRYFFGRDENSWYDPITSNPSLWDDGVPSTNETDQMGAQAQITGVLGISTLTAGFDWLNYDIENSWTPTETSYENPALFLLGKTSFLDKKLTINYGLRYDWYKVEVNEAASSDEDTSRLTPLLGAAWQLSENIKIRAQYAQGFVMPSANQLAADYSSGRSTVMGNPDLDPEKSSTYEAGIDLERNGFTGSFTYFHSDYEDKIVTNYLSDGSQSWENLGDSTIAGFEAGLAYDIGVPFEWAWEVKPYLNLTILTDYTNNETDEDLLYVNGTTLSSGLAVDNGNGIFCRFNVTYSSSQDIQDYESGTYPTPIIELDSFIVANLTASWKFYENDTLGAFTVRGELTNIFDEEYTYVKGYPMPGRGIFVSLRWDY